jgi:hypothetical protein
MNKLQIFYNSLLLIRFIKIKRSIIKILKANYVKIIFSMAGVDIKIIVNLLMVFNNYKRIKL